jgi:hypothetical protein
MYPCGHEWRAIFIGVELEEICLPEFDELEMLWLA